MKAENNEVVSKFLIHPLAFYFIGMLAGCLFTLLVMAITR